MVNGPHRLLRSVVLFRRLIWAALLSLAGEKTNPVPIESTIRGSSAFVSDCIVFGAGRSQIGAVIILSDSVPSTASPSEAFALVKPALDLANSAAPSHSQLAEDAIAFLPFGTVIPRADKGSFLRPKVYVALKDVIDGVYDRIEGEGVRGTTRFESEGDLKNWLLEVVVKTAGRNKGLAEETDLFDFGLDSLEAGRIRNELQRVRIPSFCFLRSPF